MADNKTELRLTPTQLATVLTFDAQITNLQTAANQLGGFLKLTAEAETLIAAARVINDAKEKLLKEWSGAVVLVPAGELPKLRAINGESKAFGR